MSDDVDNAPLCSCTGAPLTHLRCGDAACADPRVVHCICEHGRAPGVEVCVHADAQREKWRG